MKKNVIKNIYIILFTAVFMLSSCNMIANPESATVVERKKPTYGENEYPENEILDRKWNILVYMSADNNLESAALEDIYEMESSRLNTSEISVFALLDRSVAYDTSENNWSGTRLYRIKSGRKSDEKKMISEEIECPDLGLEVGKNTELDMSSGYVMTKAVEFIMEKFPADNYGFIMWGHGTGWRNEKTDIQKGFAFDESSNTYMTLKQFSTAIKNALNDKKLSFIGFDTCFGGELETVYELRNSADYFVGSEGLVMASGWNYTNLFDLFQRCSDKNARNLCSCVIEQFKKQYENTNKASIVSIDMKYVDSYYNAADDFLHNAAELINNKETQQELLGVIYSDKNSSVEKYTYGSEKSDVYIDLNTLVLSLNGYFGNKLNELKNKIAELDKNMTLVSWASDRDRGGLGVYFSTLTTTNLLSTVHPSAYIKNKTYDQIDFVKDSKGYVPTSDCYGSFLDKLFYAKF